MFSHFKSMKFTGNLLAQLTYLVYDKWLQYLEELSGKKLINQIDDQKECGPLYPSLAL